MMEVHTAHKSMAGIAATIQIHNYPTTVPFVLNAEKAKARGPLA